MSSHEGLEMRTFFQMASVHFILSCICISCWYVDPVGSVSSHWTICSRSGTEYFYFFQTNIVPNGQTEPLIKQKIQHILWLKKTPQNMNNCIVSLKISASEWSACSQTDKGWKGGCCAHVLTHCLVKRGIKTCSQCCHETAISITLKR